MRPIVLLSDFGRRDHYAGVLHCALAREAPGADRIDLGHEVPPGDVWHASHMLRCAWPHLPEASIVLAVVDPGVGGERRAVAVWSAAHWLVAPDNGLAASAPDIDLAVSLDWRVMDLPKPSRTFQGRDLFAPAAARLVRGDDPLSLGRAVAPDGLVPCPIPEPTLEDDGWHATVVHVDRFGNLITNLPAQGLSSPIVSQPPSCRSARMVTTYADGGEGELLVLEGSSGLLELAVGRGSAAGLTGLARGDTLVIAGS